MSKIFAFFAAIIMAAGTLCASNLAVNGDLTSENNIVKGWTFNAPENSGAAMQIIAGTPNKVKLTGPAKGAATFVGSKIPVVDKSNITISLDIEKGNYAIVGFYLHTAAGLYVSSRTRVISNAPGGKVSITLPASDPTNKGFKIGQIAPFVQVRNKLSCTISSINITADKAVKAEVKNLDPSAIVVRTIPCGYYDDKVGYLYSDAMSMIQFPIWNLNGKFADNNVKFVISLPENCRIVHAANFRNPLDRKRISRNGNQWTLDFGAMHFNNQFTLRPPNVWAQFVPLTFSNITLLVAPEKGKTLPAAFDVPWEITGSKLTKVAGVCKFKTLPLPQLNGKLNKFVWSWFSSAGQMWTRDVYLEQLKIFKSLGLNGLVDTKSGYILPEHAYPTRKLKAEFGITPVMMQMFNATMRPTPDQMRAAGYNVTERDLKINASGKRETNPRTCKTRQIYCFTAMAEPDSPVRKFMVDEYKKEAARGIEYFFPDYEPTAGNTCWCELCRKAFAKFINADEAEILKMLPGEIVARYPLRHWEFVNRKIAGIFKLLNEETGAKVGWNSCLVLCHTYFPPTKSYGYAAFAEDPRYFDDSVAFHNADTLMTATRSVFDVEAFMQKNPDGSRMLKKPVISRASSLVCNNWMYIVVLGHAERLKLREYDGIGLDYRRAMQKLEIVGHFAVGVDGVEINCRPECSDAAAVTGIVEGLQYAVNYQDKITLDQRRDQRKEMRIFDVTAAESPFAKIGPKGSLGRYIWQFINLYGVVQGYLHGKDNERTITLLNWDFYQDKQVRVELDALPAGGFVNVNIDNKEYYTFDRKFNKEFSLDIPKGCFAVVTIGNKALYAQRKAPDRKGGKRLASGMPYSNVNLKYFIDSVNNLNRGLMRRYPDGGFRLLDSSEWKVRSNDL